ncbi:MAG: hypothetical protein RQ855_06800 [Desulfurococcales archaeon]|nr:hypothetical protein [Desulfurococcales archaeon]
MLINRAFYPLYKYLLMIMLLAMIPAAAGLWSDMLEISVRVKTGAAVISITSYKAYGFKELRDGRCIASDASVNIGDNGKTLQAIFTGVGRGWFGWIGIVISNDGSFPRSLPKLSVAIVPATNFSTSIFLYGPFRSPGNSGVWDSVDICLMRQNMLSSGNPFPGNMDHYSVYLEPGYKAISWIFINYTGSESIEQVKITITLNSP